MSSVSTAETGMREIDRIDLFESALDQLQEGIALLDSNREVVFWNRVAETVTGYQSMELTQRPIPHGLAPLIFGPCSDWKSGASTEPNSQHRHVVKLRHKLGYEVEATCRVLILRDGLEEPIGMAVMFHATETFGALPRGSPVSSQAITDVQAEIEERLRAEFQNFEEGGPSIGVLCITVDQAEELSRTHGLAACEALLDKLEHVLWSGLHGSESIARWGLDEFLVILHEPSPERLTAHARLLAGLARTVDFRWWGDRISITVSLGVAQARHGGSEQIVRMLARARQGMESSLRAGGNSVTWVAEGPLCLPS